MKISIKKKDLIYLYIGFIVSIFTISGQLLTYIMPSSTIRLFFITSIFFIIFLIITQNYLVSDNKLFFNAILLFCMGVYAFYNDDWWNLYNIFLYILILVLCFMSAYTYKWITYFFYISLTAYIIYAICTIFFYFDSDLYLNKIVNLFPETKDKLIEWYNSGCMAGLTDHYSTNAMFLTVGLIISFTGCANLWKNKHLKLLLTLLFVITLLLTGKRGHIVFAIASLFALYYFSIKKEKGINRGLKFIGIILIIICLASILFPMIPALSVFIERFQTAIDSGNISTNRVQILWPLAIKGFKTSPLFGLGWCQYTSTLSPQIVGPGTYYHAHNVYLQLLCDTGILGFTIYITWMIKSLFSTLANYKNIVENTSSNSLISYMAFSLGFQIFFLLYNFTGNALYDEEMYIPYFVACAINIHYSFQINKTPGFKDVKQGDGHK